MAAIFCAYFIQLYLHQTYIRSNLDLLEDTIPYFFNRFRYTMLGYGFTRERIINNDTLDSFALPAGEENSQYGKALDVLYIEKSIENERAITNLKVEYPAITQSIIELM